MKFIGGFELIVRVFAGGNHKWNFHHLVTPIPKAVLKKPTYGSESADQRSNQLRHRETVVELSPDVHA
jgi:hypothetical protein